MPDTATGLRHVEHVMGTVFSFDIRDKPTPAIHNAVQKAVQLLHRVDAVFSTYRPDSHISRLGRGEIDLGDCPPEVHEALTLCAQATHVTDGWFSTTPAGSLDPSGLVKGWATEAASQLLHAAGAHNSCVNGGGDLQLRGQATVNSPWRVGIAHPLRPGELATVITADRTMAVATSGTAERGAHILDPHTGAPATAFAALTIIGPRLTMTDAYATAAFARGRDARDWLESMDGYEALAILPDGRFWRTSGFSRYGV
ncbi:FAD:protein FMN transferase [Streptomyces poriferorum]|uniref:FAD:protein FMN transferase n=1 Tax=Streptomyces poriferorum TaxID=2798799 RepID=A0ABY9J468_9ACTN|nr:MULTISPECIES: FAD:protein FMN transferase [unclassified Streptomyces]MDP5309865.1 FAD:protein FMN transferase [Streptomyces sp. Alt4]WLQ60957.1 FAD:protein FMN transferase [Streptomyces sp. Alt2]